MSLLWPDTWSAGLFPGHSWVLRGRVELASVEVDEMVAPRDLLSVLDALLTRCDKALGKRDRLNIVVSDSVAAVVSLPWQEQLTAPQEQRAYAHACFEQCGFDIDDSWVMQTGFRWYQAPGIAYAVPNVWLQELTVVTQQRGLRLGSVMPVSAAGYWQHRQRSNGRPDVLLLSELRRVTALIYERGRFVCIDVEPVVTDRAVAERRLFKRLTATRPDVGAIFCWHGGSGDGAHPGDAVTAFDVDVKMQHLKRDIWS